MHSCFRQEDPPEPEPEPSPEPEPEPDPPDIKIIIGPDDKGEALACIVRGHKQQHEQCIYTLLVLLLVPSHIDIRR